MTTFNKPEFNSVWASGGTKTSPEPSKITQGWVVEIPPFEYDNWIRNRQDAMLAHINQAGIVAWDVSVEYQAGKSYVQGLTTGVVYKALTTHTGQNPELDLQGNWEVAFQRSGEALLKAQNLADVPNKALARTNLGIATTADYDLRYLRQSQNFADLPSKPTARGNLDVYSKQEVIDLINTMQPAGEVAPFARSTAPNGWLVCDGSAVSRTTYSRLFAVIGTTFGGGNGSTTFTLPDLRGEFVRGWDAGRGADIGRGFGTFQANQNQSHSHNASSSAAGGHAHGFNANTTSNGYHTHNINDPGHSHPIPGAILGGNGVPERGPDGLQGDWWRINSSTAVSRTYISVAYDGTHSHTVNGTTGSTGSHAHGITVNNSGGNESRPRNVALLYCIRT